MEGLARQSRCPECNQQTLLPVSLPQQGTCSISTWCIDCSAYVEPVVDRGDYARLASLPSGAVLARIPPDSTELLSGPISTEDQEYGLQELPNGKAPNDSGLSYEMLKGATVQMKQVIRACLNSIGLSYEMLKGATVQMKQFIRACLNSILEGKLREGRIPSHGWASASYSRRGIQWTLCAIGPAHFLLHYGRPKIAITGWNVPGQRP